MKGPSEAPHFDARGALVAPRFGDLYQQPPPHGLAETRHVFVDGNDLPQRFAELAQGAVFTVGETGFGTGLNFLAAWQAFRDHAPVDARLTWISVEAHPLDPDTLRRALAAWRPVAHLSEQLCAAWPARTLHPGDVLRRSFDDGRITLCVLVGDGLDRLRAHPFTADAFCLDGFAPSKNPGLWSPELLAEVAAHAAPGSSFATFSVAGAVRRGLQAAGATLQRRPGYGRKREMLTGTFGAATDRLAPAWEQVPPSAHPAHVTVFGAGLAGSWAARAFAERGAWVTVFDPAGVAGGASGQTALVFQPRLGGHDAPDARIVARAHRVLLDLLVAVDPQRETWQTCGVLHPAADDAQEALLRARLAAAGLPDEDARWLENERALWLPTSGVLRPRALCARLLDHPRIAFRQESKFLEARTADAFTILACGPDTPTLDPEARLGLGTLSLKATRGQATLAQSEAERPAEHVVCGTGYVAPLGDDRFVTGSTYDTTDLDLAPRSADDRDNLARPGVPRGAVVLAAETGLRTTTPDRVPRVGPLPDPAHPAPLRAPASRPLPPRFLPGIWVTVGHGSRGSVTAPLAAELLAAWAYGEATPLDHDLAVRLLPARSLRRTV